MSSVGCYPHVEAVTDDRPPRLVKVIEIRETPVTDSVTLTGTTEPWRSVTLYFETSGVVAEVSVEQGDFLEQGQTVARLVLHDYELALSQAEAVLEASGARLNLLRAGSRREDLEAAEADYARARIRVEHWKKELARTAKLTADRAISDAELDRVQHEYDAACQEERSTKAHWQRAVAGPRQEEIDAAQAQVRADEQALALARRRLDKATLRAPFGGYVESRLIDPGAYVHPPPAGGVPVVEIVDLDGIDAVIDVPEALRSLCSGKPQIRIRSAVRPGLCVETSDVSLGRVADSGTGTYQLRARFENADHRFTGGMVVTAEVARATSRRAVRVPLNAVCHAYGQPPYVSLVEPADSRVVSRQITLGPLAGESVEVTGGLQDGELLIVQGQDRVVAGDRVRYELVSPDADVPSESLSR